ncbi:MAG: hypothetical protein DMG81_14170 [Acidobacteria bacterium]|nr:MAG: hypothetical protein DMG81_14170 [Acidobacteriota bacterium]
MRPLGVTIIAILTWLRASLYALGGLMLIGVGHLSARLVSAIATDSFLERVVSGLGKALGVGALMIALAFIVIGFGLWELKGWARTATLILATLWLLSALLSVMRYPSAFHIVRALVDVAILVYLMLPQVKGLFAPTSLPAKL